MATNCDVCGVRENEVKGASGIEPQARKITLKITDVSDMTFEKVQAYFSLTFHLYLTLHFFQWQSKVFDTFVPFFHHFCLVFIDS
jgi:hypothetical protein